jgi:hypothetical protein
MRFHSYSKVALLAPIDELRGKNLLPVALFRDKKTTA